MTSSVTSRQFDGAMPPDAMVRESLEYCRQFAKQRAENFYYGMKLTPEPKRSALYAIYAFMCMCDDLADENLQADDAHKAAAQIEIFRRQMQQVIDSPGGTLPPGAYWPAFAHVMATYPIDPKHLHAMLDGQRLDLTVSRYDTFDQLYDYCFKVASTVGLVCISVWGHDGDAGVLKMAEHRGIALQLTNILRDVVEDWQRDRVYLPAEDFERFKLNVKSIGDGEASDAFDQFMTFQLDRAAKYYEQSAALDQHIDPACRSTSWAIMRIYRALFNKIRTQPRRVLQGRTRLSKLYKVFIAATAMARGSRK